MRQQWGQLLNLPRKVRERGEMQIMDNMVWKVSSLPASAPAARVIAPSMHKGLLMGPVLCVRASVQQPACPLKAFEFRALMRVTRGGIRTGVPT